MASTELRHDPEAATFHLLVDGEPVGYLSYRCDGHVYDLAHTVVDPRFEGRGYGSALVEGVVQHVRDEGGRLIPTCSFVAHWIAEHPQNQDLVAG